MIACGEDGRYYGGMNNLLKSNEDRIETIS